MCKALYARVGGLSIQLAPQGVCPQRDIHLAPYGWMAAGLWKMVQAGYLRVERSCAIIEATPSHFSPQRGAKARFPRRIQA